MSMFLAGPAPPQGAHQYPRSSEVLPSWAKLLRPPHPPPWGPVCRIFSPPLLFHKDPDPFCYCFSRLIEYVLLS